MLQENDLRIWRRYLHQLLIYGVFVHVLMHLGLFFLCWGIQSDFFFQLKLVNPSEVLTPVCFFNKHISHDLMRAKGKSAQSQIFESAVWVTQVQHQLLIFLKKWGCSNSCSRAAAAVNYFSVPSTAEPYWHALHSTISQSQPYKVIINSFFFWRGPIQVKKMLASEASGRRRQRAAEVEVEPLNRGRSTDGGGPAADGSAHMVPGLRCPAALAPKQAHSQNPFETRPGPKGRQLARTDRPAALVATESASRPLVPWPLLAPPPGPLVLVASRRRRRRRHSGFPSSRRGASIWHSCVYRRLVGRRRRRMRRTSPCLGHDGRQSLRRARRPVVHRVRIRYDPVPYICLISVLRGALPPLRPASEIHSDAVQRCAFTLVNA